MKFPTIFSRYLPGNGVPNTPGVTQGTLGDDVMPPADTPPPYQHDNIFSCRVNNINGWPPQRIVVVCRFVGTGAPATIPCTLYFYERGTGTWYALNAAPVAVTPTTSDAGPGDGTPAYFDMPALLDLHNTKQTLDASGPGQIAVMLIAGVPTGSPPTGEYRFGIAADLTTSP
jgi:hypothetical protein